MKRLLLSLTSFVFLLMNSCELQSKPQVGLLVVATGKYIQFVQPLIDSARKHFCPNSKVTYYIFTDGKVPEGDDIVQIYQQRMGWPYDTMMRCKLYLDSKELLKNEDYIFACDADMLFLDTVGEEILSYRVAVEHHGYVNKPETYAGVYETNPLSKAYIAYHEKKCYCRGGFYGGLRDEFLTINAGMLTNITADLSNNYIAIWHDESHINRYFVDNPPTLILSSSYCCPEGWVPYHKRLMALDKNHQEIRK